MKQTEAKRLIVQAWDRWTQRHSLEKAGLTGIDTLKFFIELEDSRSPLLNFQTKGRQDKWLTVHAWLVSEARIQG